MSTAHVVGTLLAVALPGLVVIILAVALYTIELHHAARGTWPGRRAGQSRHA